MNQKKVQPEIAALLAGAALAEANDEKDVAKYCR